MDGIETKTPMAEVAEESRVSKNFIEEIIEADIAQGKIKSTITRFPPEPNGCLHIGHAKSLCINFGMKEKYRGKCNLRFDDTNPVKEDEEYVESIQEDIKWLGFKWDKKLYASDYFEKMYQCAVVLIKKGLAYVCDLSAEEIKNTRGTLIQPGVNSPYRNRSVQENLELFKDMRQGKYGDGQKVLRAKIDMASPNLNMRDPVLYRIVHAPHHNTGNKWCIYPMYDFAHPIEDAIEGITHSLCTLEFEDHRPIYDWVVENCDFEKKPQQIEFARLNVANTVMSKRFLNKLVSDKIVFGWDDPRMPTLCGIRRRGYPAEAVRDFCERVGVSKSNSQVEMSYLEACVRENLNQNADRVMAVLDPVKVVVTNYKGKETLSVENNPNAAKPTTRKVSFSDEIYIDRSDFEINPPPKYFRLQPNGYVRLKGAYIVKCEGYETDEQGNVTLIKCSYLPDSKSGNDHSGVKVKGVIQWVDAKNCTPIEVRRLFPLLLPVTDGETDFLKRLNPDSMKIFNGFGEKCLKKAKTGARYQFIRLGYFSVDKDSTKDVVVFNEIVGLKDSFNAKS